MKTAEILNLDYRKKENKDIIQKILRKIVDYDKEVKRITIDVLEKYIMEVESEYSVMINYISTVFLDGTFLYCATIRDKECEKITDYVYSSCIYELYAKICILYCSKIRKEKCKKVNWKELRKKIVERNAK